MSLQQHDACWHQAIYLTEKLVSIKSTSYFTEKIEVLKFVQEYLGDTDTQIITPTDADPYLISKLVSQSPEYHVILSGHLDTVAEGTMNSPFTPFTRNGCLFGRGAVDMKGGCAAMLQALIAFKDNAHRTGNVSLVFTLDEETSSLSVEHAIKNEIPKADLAIIGEPSNLSLALSHKGSHWIKVGFQGKSCHASTPLEGQNAIVMAATFINRLESFVKQQFADRRHHLCGLPTLSIGSIQGGGDFPNIVPDVCEIVIDRRWNPNETTDLIWQDIETIIQECQEEDPNFSAKILPENYQSDRINPPLDFSHQTEMINRLTKAISISGIEPVKHQHFGGWSEAALFEKSGIPALIFGPGDVKSAHTLEENIEIKQIVQASKAYYYILQELCAS